MTVRVDVTPNAKLFSFDSGHQLVIYKDSDAEGAFLRMVTAEYGISSDTRIGLPSSVPEEKISEVLSELLDKITDQVAGNALKALQQVLQENMVIQQLIRVTGGPRQPTPFARVVESNAGQGILLQKTINEVNSLVLVTDQGNAVVTCPDVASQRVGFESPEVLISAMRASGPFAEFFEAPKAATPSRSPRPGR
jgi:hypothetical protein